MTTATKTKTTPSKAKATRTRKPAASKATHNKAADRDLAVDFQRPLWVAVGAVALAGDALEHFFDDALKRGEKMEKKARKDLKSFTGKKGVTVERVRKAEGKAKQKAKRETVKLSDRVLSALDLPTHKDFRTLERKIDDLAKRVA